MNQEPDNNHFTNCLQRLKEFTPFLNAQPLNEPMHLLAWRVDCPPRAILYHGPSTAPNLCTTAPHKLIKFICPDKIPNRTVSGVCLLANAGNPSEVHDAIRSCIASDVVKPHPDFSNHPHHRVQIRQQGGERMAQTTTTLAEAVSVFTGPPPSRLKEVPLHESIPWEDDHVDER